MSDQKTEDSKSPLARRGARPFVGPAGASGVTRPPLFRPAVPAMRIASTPALPPRPALGAPPHATPPVMIPPTPIVPPTPEATVVADQQPPAAFRLQPAEQIEEAHPIAEFPAATVPSAEISPVEFSAAESEPEAMPFEAALPVLPLRPTTPAQTFEITIPEPSIAADDDMLAQPAAEQASPSPDHWSVAVTPAYTPTFQSVIDEVPPADDVMSSLVEPPASSFDVSQPEEEVLSSEAPQPESFDAPAPPVTRPVTSEMVAIDAFEAFETVWDATPEAAPAQPEEVAPAVPDPVVASPLDGESLGSGIDAQHLWGDEITRDTGDYQAYEPAPEPVTSADADEAPIQAGWASHTTPELPIPAWLEDDTASAELFQEQPDPAESAPDVLPPASHEATSSSVVGSVPNGSPWSDPRMAAYAAFVTSPDGVPIITNAFANDKQLRGRQVSAALERLAERIRDGEIDVSSVAPEAPDAAMLASVLAALLGGSNSR